jgi:hypothetical protein
LHTPTHAALNFLALGRDRRSPRWWIFAGAVLPDLPMFAFFAFERFVRGEDLRRIFEVAYFEPGWQTLFDVAHSIPLFLVIAAVSAWRKSRAGIYFASSLLLHSLVDWPTHLEDAHAYFWPFWREPLRGFTSYWHRGSLFWLLEAAILAVALFWLAAETRLGRRMRAT